MRQLHEPSDYVEIRSHLCVNAVVGSCRFSAESYAHLLLNFSRSNLAYQLKRERRYHENPMHTAWFLSWSASEIAPKFDPSILGQTTSVAGCSQLRVELMRYALQQREANVTCGMLWHCFTLLEWWRHPQVATSLPSSLLVIVHLQLIASACLWWAVTFPLVRYNTFVIIAA